MVQLKFGKANAKLVALQRKMKGKVYTFDTLSGYACPFAHNCLSRAVEGANGRRTIKDGPNTLFRCFSASQEALFTNVFKARKANFEALRRLSCEEMTAAILANLPKDCKIVRVHVAGDFFNQANFDAWLAVASARPDVLFYAYTKSLPYWVARLGQIPENFVLTASEGGRRDDLIAVHGLRSATVIADIFDRKNRPNGVWKIINQHKVKNLQTGLTLPVDHDDNHAATMGGSFALFVHGSQAAGSTAGKAKRKLAGQGSYRRKDK